MLKKNTGLRIAVLSLILCLVLTMTTGMMVFAANFHDYGLEMINFNINQGTNFAGTFRVQDNTPDGTTGTVTYRYYTMTPYELVEEYRQTVTYVGGQFQVQGSLNIDTTGWVSGEYKLAIHVDRDLGYGDPLAVGYFDYVAAAPVMVPAASHSLDGYWARQDDGVGIEISGSAGVLASFGTESNEWMDASEAGVARLGDVKFSQIQLVGDNEWAARDLWVIRENGVPVRTSASDEGTITMSADGQRIDVWSKRGSSEFTFTYVRSTPPAAAPALAANQRAIELAPNVPGTVSFPEAGVAIELILPGGGEGTVSLDKMNTTDKALPEELEALGVFMKIERSEGLAGVQATIKVDLPQVPEGVEADTLALYRYNESTGVWDLLPSEMVNGQVWATVVDFSLFGLFAQPVAAVAPAPAPVPVPAPAPAPEPAPAPAPAAPTAPVALPRTDGGSALPLGMMAAVSLMTIGGYLTLSRKKK